MHVAEAHGKSNAQQKRFTFLYSLSVFLNAKYYITASVKASHIKLVRFLTRLAVNYFARWKKDISWKSKFGLENIFATKGTTFLTFQAKNEFEFLTGSLCCTLIHL